MRRGSSRRTSTQADRGAAPPGDDPRHAPVPAGLAVFGALTGISAVAAVLTGVRLAG
jgi:hypothetical protein